MKPKSKQVFLWQAGVLMPAFAKTENGPLTDMQITTLATYLSTAIPSR